MNDKNSALYCNIIELESYLTMVKLSEGIFHDFKNILATISGLAQISMLQEDLGDIRKNLKTITKAAFDGRDSIDIFGLFIKGQHDIDMKPKYVNDIISSTLDLASYKLSSNNKTRIGLELNLFSKALINCYEYGLRQSLLNLLLNSIESMEDKGGSLIVNTFDTYDTLVIEIIDSGVGIPNEIMNKIFEPYFTTKGERGTGLGMKIVKDTLDKHGAKIEIKSIVGMGTKVIILAPIVGYVE